MKMNEELIESLYDQVNKNPHKVLYISVILQALLDLLKIEREEEASSITLERDQARAWFFASIGVTCENFTYTCELAGVDPNTIRTFAIKAVTVKDNSDIRKKLNSFLQKELDEY